VAIEGRSLGEAAKGFQEHLNDLLAHTITQTRVVVFSPERSSVAVVSFRADGKPTTATLRTRFGTMELFLHQRCGSFITPERRHRLTTSTYNYTLTPAGHNDPEIRWEYLREREDAEARWPRHHVQGPFSFRFGNESVSANSIHLPSGFVTIEEVIRFCIVDLGVDPRSDDWNERLDASYHLFKTDFAPGDPGGSTS